MIPRLIHQTAKTAQVPDKWAPLQKKVQDLHSEWTYRLWTDTDNDQLIRQHYPQLAPVYFGMPKPIMRADLIRYVYMHQFGGLYLDTDYEFLKPFDLLDRPLVLPRESSPEQPLFLGNCVFASQPGHPFWTAVLAQLQAHPPGQADLTHEDAVIKLTGPGLLTQVYQQQFLDDSSVLVTPKAWFHPTTPQTDAEYRTITKDSSCYGIHFCFGSWRALSFKERLKARIAKFWRR